MIWFIIALTIILSWIFYLVLRCLKAGQDYDNRMDDICGGEHRYNYPKDEK